MMIFWCWQDNLPARRGPALARWLVALFDPAHPNHDEAHAWFGRSNRDGWATTTLTVNGCVRSLSSTSYPTVRARPEEVVRHLRQLCQNPHHRFWSDTTNILDPAVVKAELIAGHKNITDISLLALACRNEGRLVTFDRSILSKAGVGATPQHLEVLGGKRLLQ